MQSRLTRILEPLQDILGFFRISFDSKSILTTYEVLKLVHVSCVVISGSLFIYRFSRLNLYPGRSLTRWLKVLPHINDTALLAAAIGMLVTTGINAFHIPWLTAKLGALLAYIVLGTMSLHARSRSRRQVIFFTAALTTYAYIVLVALSKRVVPL